MQHKKWISRVRAFAALGVTLAARRSGAEEFKPLTLQSKPALAIGKAAPEMTALDGGGAVVPLFDGKAKWTVIAFLSTRCACTARYLERLETVQKAFAAQDVRFVGVNSNANEQAADVRFFAKSQELTFPLLKDTDDRIAFALRPRATPEIFVLDANRIVRYHGAIDDSLYGDKVTHFYLRDALSALTAGKPLLKSDIPVLGCGIFVPK